MSATDEEILGGKKYFNLTPEERDKILNFFDRNWEALAGPENEPKLALVKRKELNTPTSAETDYEIMTKTLGERAGDVYKLVGLMRDVLTSEHDVQLTKGIPPEHVKIVDLPFYEQLFPINKAQE